MNKNKPFLFIHPSSLRSSLLIPVLRPGERDRQQHRCTAHPSERIGEKSFLSTNEVYADSPRVERKAGRRIAVVAVASLLVACALGIAALFIAAHRKQQHASAQSAAGSASEAPPAAGQAWTIRGSLTEACTCAVPCTCNFGQGPSPHAYCYPFYSYDIRQGKYGDVALDGLHFGATELKGGRTIFIDERAGERQREALRVIAARVIERLSVEEAEKKAREVDPDVRYAAVKQEYDERRNHLEVAGLGEFAADYIMGLDKSQPLVVRNNTTWRIRDAIKAKTSLYRVKVGPDAVDTKDTNSNQGEFEYTDKTDFGAPVCWNCSAGTNEKAQAPKGDQMCRP
jgi:hypothetical protein